MALGLLTTKVEDGVEYKYNITDAKIKGWSSHYGEEGGGFGYLRFSVERPVGSNNSDIGIMRWYPPRMVRFQSGAYQKANMY